MFSDKDQSQPPWHELSLAQQTNGTASKNLESEAEQIVSRYSGLNKNDFVAIQGKLFDVSNAKAQGSMPNRNQSLRRRRPSTSHSIYSFTADDIQVCCGTIWMIGLITDDVLSASCESTSAPDGVSFTYKTLVFGRSVA